MTFLESIKTCFKKYATFSGRASRSEFLWWCLFCLLTIILFTIFEKLISTISAGTSKGIISGITHMLVGVSKMAFSVIAFSTSIAVSTRRLHDINLSGKFVSAPLLLFIFSITSQDNTKIISISLLLVTIVSLSYKKGTTGDNRFGKDPLQN